jgi:sphingolipid delta-4 desaturase
LASLLMLAAVYWLGGWQSLAYLYLSAVFMSGFLQPTTFGMILNDSHFHSRREYQPSTSYYGWLNRLTFNFGLHTEHHDFPGIPWSRLPKLRQLAPEHYEPLAKTKSYAGLAAQFVFEPRSDRDSHFDNELSRTDEASRHNGHQHKQDATVEKVASHGS